MVTLFRFAFRRVRSSASFTALYADWRFYYRRAVSVFLLHRTLSDCTLGVWVFAGWRKKLRRSVALCAQFRAPRGLGDRWVTRT